METMNDRVLRLVHKAATAAENGAFLERASNAGISLQVNLIPDLPTTTFLAGGAGRPADVHGMHHVGFGVSL